MAFFHIFAFLHKIMDVIYLTYREPPVIFCANCQEGYVDSQERLFEWCWQRGCPGCSVCGNYIDKDEMLEICSECIIDHEGQISEDDCNSVCPYYEDGLEEVRMHYDITLDAIKLDLGY